MAKKLIALVLGIMMLMTVAVSGIAEEKSDLHIADDVTLRFFFDLDLAANVPGMQNYNDSDAYKWLEEQTGIHIEWIHPASGTSREAFNLLFASDDMPYLIYNSIPNGFVYPSGHDMAIADGVYANLKDYEDLMPNYMAIVNSNEILKRESVTDEGNRWCFFYIYKDGRGPNFGPTIRKDFLDKVGMDLPETYDDWHEVLTAFKEQLGIEIPLYVNKDTFMWYSEFAAGYGVTKDWSLNTEGKVIYGPCEDGYGEYLDMLHPIKTNFGEVVLGYLLKLLFVVGPFILVGSAAASFAGAIFIIRLVGVLLIVVLAIAACVACIIISLHLELVEYILMREDDAKGWEAIKRSKRYMNGNKGRMFGFELSFIGWWILVGIFFPLALYVVPYYLTSKMYFLGSLYEAGVAADNAPAPQVVPVEPYVAPASQAEQPYGAAEQPYVTPAPERMAGATKFCSNCGVELPAEAAFCNKCGAPQ